MNATSGADAVDTTEEMTLDLLSQLCERQTELSAPAHVAVMNAFNRFAEHVPPPLFCLSPHDGEITELLGLTELSLRLLAGKEPDLGRSLLFRELRELLLLALAES